MASSAGRSAIATALSLAMAGAAAGLAWAHGLWLAMAGALLAIAWLTLRSLLAIGRPAIAAPPTASETDREALVHGALLDASPTPLLLVDGGGARALNRAARRLFDTDDRILPPPPPLLDREATHLRHAGRSWRADRVELGARSVVALVDVESEERTAEARAGAEMIQVLGHELLNGLVPIVSLAECGLAAIEAKGDERHLLPEILTTLARHAEGLQRFAETYRSLARLPPPVKQPVLLNDLIEDLARLFASRWPDAVLTIAIPVPRTGMVDRDQLAQAIWALLQNAVEAADADRAAVTVSVSGQDGLIAIDVTDNGRGIPPDQATAIFRPFATTKTHGTGIGLSLARRIAQAHGGSLDLLALTPATFRLRVPGA